MSFVIRFREHDAVRFETTPAVLMALYSARLGSRGLTILHFRPQSEIERLQRGSSNAIFASDFGASAALPSASGECSTYEDLLAAIGGLVSVGDTFFFDYARRMMSRLKRFVVANAERDDNTPERVTLTLQHVNTFLGRAMSHLLDDSPVWWRNYCEAVRAIDYHGAEWQAALNGLALCLSRAHQASASSASRSTGNDAPSAPRRGPSTRTPIMPDCIRRQIPRDTAGLEPCLRFMGGGMCYGGSRDRCGHGRRTHTWEGRLPRDVQEFIERHYGADRRHDGCRPRLGRHRTKHT